MSLLPASFSSNDRQADCITLMKHIQSADSCAARECALTTILAEQAAPYTDVTWLVTETVHRLRGNSNTRLNTLYLQKQLPHCLKTAWNHQ